MKYKNFALVIPQVTTNILNKQIEKKSEKFYLADQKNGSSLSSKGKQLFKVFKLSKV